MKKIIAAIMSILTVFVPMTSWADQGTTTMNTAYKDISANTEIYAVTDISSGDYPKYGAKWEPEKGVYFGRTADHGTLSSGGYGLVNYDLMKDESITSYYYSIDNEYSLKHWSYIYGKPIEDGNQAFLLNLNFENEADDCKRVLDGVYDEKLQEDFQLLNTISCPVFLRIGGEMNVWENKVSPSLYIDAFRHVASRVQWYCPDVAVVFSPNYSSPYQVDMDSYYPGDEYTDWIGCSLYFNRYANNGDTNRDQFYGVNRYGDALLNVQQTVHLSDIHHKPVIITESGSAWFDKGENLSWFSTERIEKAYAYLTMLYPQIKAIVYSDTDFGKSDQLFSFRKSESSDVKAAYDKAVASNPTLLRGIGSDASYYTKISTLLSENNKTLTGKVTLAAYTYSSSRLNAEWFLDGVSVEKSYSYPLQYVLDTEKLSEGSHTVKVLFSNGEKKSFTFQCFHGVTDTNEESEILLKDFPFKDVSSSAWYYNDVKEAFDTGLINGFEDNTFRPDENMTYAQAVKLAACMNQKYTTGSVTLGNGSPNWYDGYVDYAKSNNIISRDYEWNTPATRAGYAEIFANALPDEALKAKNSIADNAIPDVSVSHSQSAEIYKLYRAGILTGNDETGTFAPDRNIKRSEVSAILTRMMNDSARKDLTLGSVTPDNPGTTYAIAFNSNGGSETEPQSVKENGYVVKPADPTREGFNFVGWYSDNAFTTAYDFTKAVIGNLTLYAKWDEILPAEYIVSFESNGGSVVEVQIVKENEKAAKPADPTREGFNFAGWYSDSGLTTSYDFTTTVTENLTLYAKWDEILPTEYIVSFESNGGSVVEAQKVKENEKAAKPADPTRESFNFAGWYSDSDLTTEYDFNSPVREDCNLYAKWEQQLYYIPTEWIITNGYSFIGDKQIIGDTYEIHLTPGSTYQLEIQVYPGDANNNVGCFYHTEYVNGYRENGDGISVSDTGLITVEDWAYGDMIVNVQCANLGIKNVYVMVYDSNGHRL